MQGGVDTGDLAGIGLTNQRETTIVWDKRNGRPVYNAIIWQCRRTAEYCERLKKDGMEPVIRAKTGLPVDAYFSATKLMWLLDNVDGVRAGAEAGHFLFGTVDSWLLWNLTQGRVHATDYSNASRTMLFNIHTLAWDEELLQAMNIPRGMLPEVKRSSHVYGRASADTAVHGVPLAGIAGDQQAALFGQCCHEPGSVKNTYGTGCFILMNTGEKTITSSHGLLTTIAWGYGGKISYALEGSVFITGAAVQWLHEGLRLLDAPSLAEVYANNVPDTLGVYVVPAFAGLGAPYWDQYARGLVIGLTQGVKKEHFIRATLESLAYQSLDVIKAMEADAQLCLRSVRVDGGASVNDFIMQFQADILGVEVVRPRVTETTAFGAAYLAGLAVGYYADIKDIVLNTRSDKTFRPDMEDSTRSELVTGWREAVKRCLGWEKP